MKREVTATLTFSAEALAVECDRKCRGDLGEAAALFLKRSRVENAAWYAERERSAMLEWARQFLMAARTSQRQAAVRSAARPLNATTMAEAASRFWSWPINGVPLADCRRADLEVQSKRYLADSRAFAARGSWLQAIAARMPNASKRVRDIFDEPTIVRMAAEAGVVTSLETTE
ncbi:MAG: hypothetical protein ACTHK2_04620 [Dokdonella sp.]|uniref:hypothetical protein n=1 Tax=Dokdonella sp. TaxID=2291710 RepID=UPI003F7CF94A